MLHIFKVFILPEDIFYDEDKLCTYLEVQHLHFTPPPSTV